jgi:hypothetical protein
MDAVLRGEIQLLEELGRDGYAACCADFVQRRLGVVVAIEMHVVV